MSALGLTNLDVPGFVPFGCVTTETTFYHKMVCAILLPFAGICVLCCYPLSEWLRGRPSSAATGTVKGLSMLLLVVTLPGISTCLVQVFVCDSFDDGSFLRAQLTMSCNASEQRTRWLVVATLGLVIYPVGGACILVWQCAP